MKTRRSRRQAARLPHHRWLAYATAGAATALAGSNSAEATIHYSGDLHEQFGPHKGKVKTFPLDQAGDSLRFDRSGSGQFSNGFAGFRITGIDTRAWRGFPSFSAYAFYVSRLPKGQNISAGYFTSGRTSSGRLEYGILDSDFAGAGQWKDPGIGFVGFRFNNGAGVQYGWARVRMSKLPENAFTVLDYAYADPGEPLTAGQRSSAEMAPDQGSLGWLATGAVGLLAWRKSRSRTARLKVV